MLQEISLDKTAEIERLRELVDACTIYLKEDETPVQRIERERKDTEAVLNLLLKEKRKTKRLIEKVDRSRDDILNGDREIERLREELLSRHAELRAKAEEIERLRNPEPCWWMHEGSDHYETQCGHGFEFIDGGPSDNSFTHCPFCGHPLAVDPEDDGDD